MSVRLSLLYGKDVYTDDAEYIGKVHDVILNLESGEVVRITTEPLHFVSKESAEKILQTKSVLYKNVRSAQDILIVAKHRQTSEIEEKPQPVAASKVSRLARFSK